MTIEELETIKKHEDIKAFFSLGEKMHKIADYCVNWLHEDSKYNGYIHFYSDGTNGNWESTDYFDGLHREGRYFRTDDINIFWFLGFTADVESDFSFSLAYNGGEEKLNLDSVDKNEYKKIGNWIYFKLDKSIICTEKMEFQKHYLRHTVKDLLEKLL